MPNGLWVPLLAGVFGTLIGSIATITAALINRQPTLASILNSRIVTLMQIYEKTIGELRMEICPSAGENRYLRTHRHGSSRSYRPARSQNRYHEGANGRDGASGAGTADGAARIVKLFRFCPFAPVPVRRGRGFFDSGPCRPIRLQCPRVSH